MRLRINAQGSKAEAMQFVVENVASNHGQREQGTDQLNALHAPFLGGQGLHAPL